MSGIVVTETCQLHSCRRGFFASEGGWSKNFIVTNILKTKSLDIGVWKCSKMWTLSSPYCRRLAGKIQVMEWYISWQISNDRWFYHLPYGVVTCIFWDSERDSNEHSCLHEDTQVKARQYCLVMWGGTSVQSQLRYADKLPLFFLPLFVPTK